MNQVREQQICNELLHVWAQVYDIEKELGEEHEMYDSIYKLAQDINSVEYKFRVYVEKKKSPLLLA